MQRHRRVVILYFLSPSFLHELTQIRITLIAGDREQRLFDRLLLWCRLKWKTTNKINSYDSCPLLTAGVCNLLVSIVDTLAPLQSLQSTEQLSELGSLAPSDHVKVKRGTASLNPVEQLVTAYHPTPSVQNSPSKTSTGSWATSKTLWKHLKTAKHHQTSKSPKRSEAPRLAKLQISPEQDLTFEEVHQAVEQAMRQEAEGRKQAV